MPLYAAICRSLERKLLIFIGLGFFFEPEGRGCADQRSAPRRATLLGIPPGEPCVPATQRFRPALALFLGSDYFREPGALGFGMGQSGFADTRSEVVAQVIGVEGLVHLGGKAFQEKREVVGFGELG